MEGRLTTEDAGDAEGRGGKRREEAIVFGTGFAHDFTPVQVAFGAARARGWRGIRRNP
jgi:hypothetical protein